VILFSPDAGDVGDCASTATLGVHIAIAAAIVRNLRDILFLTLERDSRYRARMCSEAGRDIVRIVDHPRYSRGLNTCPGVSIDGMAALLFCAPKSLPFGIATRATGGVGSAS
jgi:hypothetical protein